MNITEEGNRYKNKDMKDNKNIIIDDSMSSGSITTVNTWGDPVRVSVNEIGDSIEMIYKETSMITLTVYPSPPPEVRVFKIVFSVIDGKWNKSDRIYGVILAEQKESYAFEDDI